MQRPFSQDHVYMDYASTTPVDPQVLKAMIPYFSRDFGNPSSLHSLGQEARVAVEKARERIAEELGCRSKEVIFTGSATESNNLAIKGAALSRGSGHVLVSEIEHNCVLGVREWLERNGFEVETIPVDESGFVDPSKVEEMIKKETILVSVMHANNEIGTIQPIESVAEVCEKNNVLFHSDAAQTFGKMEIEVEEVGVDLLTSSSHKIYGPKGVGILFVKEGVEIEPLMEGGGQERGLRPSTLNVPAIVGLGRAVEIYENKREGESKRIGNLKDELLKGALSISGVSLNGDPDLSLFNIMNLRFDSVEGNDLLLELDSRGIYVSAGSACSAKTMEPSHVLSAIGLSGGQSKESVRFSLGRWSTKEEVDYVLKVLPEVVNKLRGV